MYTVDLWGPDVAAQIAALPQPLLAPFAELRAALALSPGTVSQPYVPSNPSGSRLAPFGPQGAGQVLFMIGRNDDDRRVTILQVTAL